MGFFWGPSWAPRWAPKRLKIGQKINQKLNCSKSSSKIVPRPPKTPPRCPPDPSGAPKMPCRTRLCACGRAKINILNSYAHARTSENSDPNRPKIAPRQVLTPFSCRSKQLTHFHPPFSSFIYHTPSDLSQLKLPYLFHISARPSAPVHRHVTRSNPY